MKHAIIAAILALTATPALSAPYGPPAPESIPTPGIPAESGHSDGRSFIQKIGPTRFAVHSLAAAFDVATTYRCTTARRTCQEGNPMLRAIFGKRLSLGESVGAFGIMEAIYLGGSYAIGETSGYNSSAMRIFQISLIGSHGIAGGLNLRF